MPEEKTVTIEPHEEIVLVRVDVVPEIEEHIREMQELVVSAGQAASNLPVVMDLSKVSLLPSLCIGALVTLLQKFRQQKQRFMLAGLQPTVRETLTICRLAKLFEIQDSVDDALSQVRQDS